MDLHQTPPPESTIPPTPPTLGSLLHNSLIFKIVSIGILILVLLIPAIQIRRLITERQERSADVIQEASAGWGGIQRIRGPILEIPYITREEKTEEVDGEKTTRTVEKKLTSYFLPEVLNIDGTINTQKRQRGIYNLIVYNTELGLSGNFVLDFEALSIPEQDILFNEAHISIAVTDVTGIKESIELNWANQKITLEPNITKFSATARGPVALTQGTKDYSFELNININGTDKFTLTPVGKETKITLSSNWADPSFTGTFLPDEHTITDQGFTANWSVLHFNRNYPQQWTKSNSTILANMAQSAFGLELFQPVDHYQKAMRSVKYSALFIFLTFLVFFFVEILSKERKRVHPVQYLLVGVANVLFYLLLLSLSEHMAFSLAYVIASIATIGLISGYVKSVFKSSKITITLAALLIALYVFLYTALNLEDYALLVGSIGLFIILAAIMYLSRKVNWYAIGSGAGE